MTIEMVLKMFNNKSFLIFNILIRSSLEDIYSLCETPLGFNFAKFVVPYISHFCRFFYYNISIKQIKK